MKKFISVFSAVLLSAISFAQEIDSTVAEQVRINTDLGVGQNFLVDETKIKFMGVISDSRCPKQVTCIWPGEAKVLLGIELNGEYFQKEVVISGGGAELALSEVLQMQITGLTPYPETAKGIAPEEYCLSFVAVLPQ
ncbi:hypothetical protein [Salinimicrobium sp. TH3]|uniref:hypothetical protein n=1 Tax=Salinimicrobium sp. TH3 TaxID=2997342 RepID=UPI0022735C25|nr:hypothetical protein [Salinimicrobium sp. TH3]MCY2686637.1 hypothetical protein [Salinimicrobium sp. TH3]